MRIGLYDVNKSSYGKMRYEFPEIDLMKVYSYYKQNKNNIIELCQDYKQYKNYDLFYIFNNRRHIVSKDLLKLQMNNNVHLIGTCFYGDTWIPMDDEIEKCEPDITSYAAFLRTNIINDTLAPWIANLFTDYYYLRYYYLDWHWNLIPNKIKDKKVILYDFDLTNNDGWQELCLQIKRDSGKKFVCRHNVIVRSWEDLKFIVDNEIYKSSTKYPTKFILDIPNFLSNFKEECDEHFNLLQQFPSRSLFLFQNHYKDDNIIEYFCELCDACMECLSKWKRIYPIYDYSQLKNNYDLFISEVGYYFLMEKPGTILDMLYRRGDPINMINELKEKTPIFYEQIKKITRAGVKNQTEEWIYGQR